MPEGSYFVNEFPGMETMFDGSCIVNDNSRPVFPAATHWTM